MHSDRVRRVPLHNGDSVSAGQTSEACRIDIMGLRLHNLHRSVIAERVIAAANSELHKAALALLIKYITAPVI